MRHSRADSSIIKLPSQSSITQQGSRRPWCSRRWAGVRTRTHTHTHKSKEHTNTMAGDHFAITLLGDFQVSLADSLRRFNQIELVAATKTHSSPNHWILRSDQVPVNNARSKHHTWSHVLSIACIQTPTHKPPWRTVHTQTFTDTPWQMHTHQDESLLSELWLLSYLSLMPPREMWE